MLRAVPTLHDERDQNRGHVLCSLALLLRLGLPMALLAACSKQAPDMPVPAASTPGNPAARASSAAAPAPVALPEPGAASAPPAAAPAEAPAPPADTAATRPGAALPPAIIAFQKQRDACDHFRGEEPFDKQRAAFLKAQLAKTCKGSDQALASLRRRFAQNPEAIAALKAYEDRIE